MRELIARLVSVGASILLAGLAVPALAQEGEGGGGASGCGDVFGDLVQIKRDPVSGVPILQKRWIVEKNLPAAWGYCPIALNADGTEIGFWNGGYVDDGDPATDDYVPPSCDPDLTTGTPVAVDYFGRLSAGRTKERNIRMHFDEVIDKIKGAEAVWRDVTGRLVLGYGCNGAVSETGATCATWTEVDSPVENISLYARLMKYGHFQTDPLEVDLWAHGDGASGSEATTQYHVALDPDVDYAKFVGETRALLPKACDGEVCYGPYAPQPLEQGDIVIAASLLATGADKTGKITLDLVQYMNRILKVPKATFEKTGEQITQAPAEVLYPNIRDCTKVTTLSEAEQQTPSLAVSQTCPVASAESYGLSTLPSSAKEPFTDYSALTYSRASYFQFTTTALRPATTLGLTTKVALEKLLNEPIADVWVVDQNVPLDVFLLVANKEEGASGANIDGFVKAASDALRAIEFVHNYRVPVTLWSFGATTAVR